MAYQPHRYYSPDLNSFLYIASNNDQKMHNVDLDLHIHMEELSHHFRIFQKHQCYFVPNNVLYAELTQDNHTCDYLPMIRLLSGLY